MAQGPEQSSDLEPRKTEAGILFQYYAPEATAVYLAGDFNNWANNVGGTIADPKFRMEGPDVNGIWQKVVPLGAGTHKFKFNIDGAADKWVLSEWAIRDYKGNGVITIAENGEVAEPKEVTFYYTDARANSVYLVGDFNNWGDNKGGVVSDPKYAMTRMGAEGDWQIEVNLSPGRYSYKFVIDGNRWVSDPGVTDKDGDGNSVLEVR